MPIDCYYSPPAPWKVPPALREKCGDYLPDPYKSSDAEIDQWFVEWGARYTAEQGFEAAVPTLAQRFQEEAAKWDRETAHLSSPLQKMMHPSYQAILGMSSDSPESKREVIGFMLRDLKANRRDWFLALSYLTQQNPIRPADAGKTSKMIASWVTWGEVQGIL
jgi:hypothetical protein